MRRQRSFPGLASLGVIVAVSLAGWTPAGATAPRKVETQTITVDAPKLGGAGVALEVHRGAEGLPPAVAKTREAILDAAYSGDLARLKAVMQRNETMPSLSVNEIDDPIAYLKSQSGDGEGLELLAILTDILESSWVRVGAGTPQEMIVWPSYAARGVEGLTPADLVELYKIVTSSDYEEMKSAQKYIFYTVGIGPDGTWHYFKLND